MPRILLGSYPWNMAPLPSSTLAELYYEGEPRRALDKSLRGMGALRCRLSWDKVELTGQEYYQLRQLVGRNPSAQVYIRLPLDVVDTTSYEPLWYTYQAQFHWPVEGVMQGNYNRWQMPDIELTNLVAYVA